MFELIKAGGWSIWPIILCSVAALAIVGERFWSLQKKYVAPSNLLAQVHQWLVDDELEPARLAALRANSPLGKILAAGLINRDHGREIVKEAIENAGRHVVPELERYLRSLGSIAAISPFLGLFGTVIGMIQMFSGTNRRIPHIGAAINNQLRNLNVSQTGILLFNKNLIKNCAIA